MKKKIIIVLFMFLMLPLCVFAKDNNQLVDSKDVIVKSVFDNDELDINKMEIKNEDDFVECFEGVLKEIKVIVSKDTITKDDKEILKKTFVQMADFVFYNKPIKGMKFNDLSISSKKKILSNYKKIDNEIEKVYPNYKDKLKSISKNKYNNLKDKVDKLLEKYKKEIRTQSYEITKKETKNIFSKINKKFNKWLKKVCG